MTKGKRIYFGVLILSIVLVTVFYVSYAFFTNKIEGKGKLNIVAGTLDYKIESSELKDNSIEVDKNSTKTLTIKITSLNKIDSKYELYYNLSKEIDGVEVKYTNKTKSNPKGIIKSKEEKEIEVIIVNNSSEKVGVTFKVHGGLTSMAYDNILKYGYEVIEKKDDFTLAYTYTGTKTRPTKFPNKGEGYIVDSITCSGADGVWDEIDWSIKFSNITSNEIYCNAVIKDEIKEVYGSSIQSSYSTIYTNRSSTTPITKIDNSDDYSSGNFSYTYSLYRLMASYMKNYITARKTPTYNYKMEVSSGSNSYEFYEQPSDSWVSFYLYCYGGTENVAVSNFKLKFSDGSNLTIKEAVNQKYIEPLAFLSSFNSESNHLWGNFYNMVSGGATTAGNYPKGMILVKIKNVPLVGYQIDSTVDWNKTYDGITVVEYEKNLKISTQPLS